MLILERFFIRALNLDGASHVAMPAEPTALGLDSEKALQNKPFNYRSVIGMLMYLSANLRPDLMLEHVIPMDRCWPKSRIRLSVRP